MELDVPLHGYPEISVGGKQIQYGRDIYDQGLPCPNHWPYLAARGWYDRKAEQQKGNELWLVGNDVPQSK